MDVIRDVLPKSSKMVEIPSTTSLRKAGLEISSPRASNSGHFSPKNAGSITSPKSGSMSPKGSSSPKRLGVNNGATSPKRGAKNAAPRFYGSPYAIRPPTGIALITGANSEVGKSTAIQLIGKGWRVVMACDDLHRGAEAVKFVVVASDDYTRPKGQEVADLMVVDMSSQASIRALAENFLKLHKHLDVLIHHATLAEDNVKSELEPTFTSENVETIWATNHVGPVLLTELLMPALKKSEQGRVITVTSKGVSLKAFQKVNMEDPEFRSTPFNVGLALYQAKLAQIMFTYWLARECTHSDVTANCVQVPPIQKSQDHLVGSSTMKKITASFHSKFAVPPEDVSNAYFKLATLERFSAVNGVYVNEVLDPADPPKYARHWDHINACQRSTKTFVIPAEDILPVTSPTVAQRNTSSPFTRITSS